MTPIEDVRKEMKAYEAARNEFFKLFDEKIPKKPNGLFDFSDHPTLDAKEVYELFYKLDYQARKLRGLLIEARDIKVG
ncbi:MAG: hypothetical protein B6D59_06860 [Campylobacteraceae bacterium 4484_4]|nr:MAG: hypothetical protein B6D59_06860 [Campylobacteraceae bacterium 4484_4]